MKNYTIDQLRAQFAKIGYKWFPYHFIGIRSLADEPNKFDDAFILIDGSNLYQYKFTTNPGTTWLQKFANPKGSAVLKPGQYIDTWAFGLHRGKYEAFVQVRPVTVWRDSDRDLKSEKGPEDIGCFGINIHKAATGITALINGNSAGCQVFQNSEAFEFTRKRSHEAGLKYFTYTLLNEF